MDSKSQRRKQRGKNNMKYQDPEESNALLSRKCTSFTKEEEIKIFNKYRNAKSEAYKINLRNQIIERNLGLVRFIARKLSFKNNTQFSTGDLMSEGTIGLMSAIEKFDPKRGYKFSTFAHFWIRQKMRYAICTNPSNRMRVPVAAFKRHKDAIANNKSGNLDLVRAAQTVLSIDKPKHYANNDSKFFEISDDRESVEDIVEKNLRIQHTREIMQKILSEREQKVVDKYYGEDATYKSIGKELGLTKERIRQIIGKSVYDLKKAIGNYDSTNICASTSSSSSENQQ